MDNLMLKLIFGYNVFQDKQNFSAVLFSKKKNNCFLIENHFLINWSQVSDNW